MISDLTNQVPKDPERKKGRKTGKKKEQKREQKSDDVPI